jgi:hypothetical protein
VRLLSRASQTRANDARKHHGRSAWRNRQFGIFIRRLQLQPASALTGRSRQRPSTSCSAAKRGGYFMRDLAQVFEHRLIAALHRHRPLLTHVRDLWQL